MSIAALHFAPTGTAVEALRHKTIAPDMIQITGNPVINALYLTQGRIA